MDEKQMKAFAQSVGPSRAERKLAKTRLDLSVAERIAENDPPHYLSEGSAWRVEEERARVEFWAEISALAHAPHVASS
jgi:hypothetical protein